MALLDNLIPVFIDLGIKAQEGNTAAELVFEDLVEVYPDEYRKVLAAFMILKDQGMKGSQGSSGS